MGFCGCSLHSSTITAAVLSVVVGLHFILFDSILLVFITNPEHFRIVKRDEESCTNIHVTNITFLQSFQCLSNYGEIVGMCSGRIILILCLIMSASVLFYGNKKNIKYLMIQWIPVVALCVAYHIGIVCYDIYRLSMAYREDGYYASLSEETKLNIRKAEWAVFVVFHNYGIIWWILAAVLAVNVYQRSHRGEDIDSSSEGSFSEDGSFTKGDDQMVMRDMKNEDDFGIDGVIPKMKFLVEPKDQRDEFEKDKGLSRPYENKVDDEYRRDHRRDEGRREHRSRDPDEHRRGNARPEAWGPSDSRRETMERNGGYGRKGMNDPSERMGNNPSGTDLDDSRRRDRRPNRHPEDEGDRPHRTSMKPPNDEPSYHRDDFDKPSHGHHHNREEHRPRDRSQRHGGRDDRRFNDDIKQRTYSGELPPRLPDDYLLKPNFLPRPSSSASDRDYRKRKELPLSDWQMMNESKNHSDRRAGRGEGEPREAKWTSYNGAFNNPVYEEDEPDYDLDPSRPSHPSGRDHSRSHEHRSRF